MQLVAGALASGRGFNPQELAEQVAEEVRTGRKSMEEALGGAQPGVGIEIHDAESRSDTTRDLLPPASSEDIAAAESVLGFPLPDDLTQLYTSVANGGFGPGVGFLSLAEVAARYQEFRSEPQGPGDEMWPAHLLPLVPVDICEACYDLKTGKIICWDPEELLDEESEDDAWDRSFKPWADSLAGWLETWLAKKPMNEQLADQLEQGRLQMGARLARPSSQYDPGGTRRDGVARRRLGSTDLPQSRGRSLTRFFENRSRPAAAARRFDPRFADSFPTACVLPGHYLDPNFLAAFRRGEVRARAEGDQKVHLGAQRDRHRRGRPDLGAPHGAGPPVDFHVLEQVDRARDVRIADPVRLERPAQVLCTAVIGERDLAAVQVFVEPALFLRQAMAGAAAHAELHIVGA